MSFLHYCFLIFLFSSSATATACDHCIRQSKAAFFARSSGLSSGACGYGSLAEGFNAGHLAAAVPSLFQNGAGCGACFQIRCKNPAVCSNNGTIVLVTDFNRSNKTDFVLSSRAFRELAKQGMDRHVLGLGIVDVEYQRVPCQYKKQNLALRIEESSKKPHYLAIKVLYQGGQTEILAVVVAQVGSSKKVYMNRNYGAVWDTSKVPSGALQFSFVVASGYDKKWIWTEHAVPSDWKNGVIYDMGVQINDIDLRTCVPCNNQVWK